VLGSALSALQTRRDRLADLLKARQRPTILMRFDGVDLGIGFQGRNRRAASRPGLWMHQGAQRVLTAVAPRCALYKISSCNAYQGRWPRRRQVKVARHVRSRRERDMMSPARPARTLGDGDAEARTGCCRAAGPHDDGRGPTNCGGVAVTDLILRSAERARIEGWRHTGSHGSRTPLRAPSISVKYCRAASGARTG